MTVANYTVNHLWLQLLKYQQQINFLVVALLTVFLLAYGAELTWRLLPQAQNEGARALTINPVKSVGSASIQLDLASIIRLNLFGDVSVQAVVKEQVIDAPVTTLNLTLSGVVSSSLKDQGAAIIENSGKQETYGVGEKITGTRVTLKEVYADRVIIKNGPANETLMLDGIDYSKPQSPGSVKIQRPEKQRQTLSDDALQASRELQQQPANFTDFITIIPHRRGEELQGYRVSPGKSPELFTSAGLKSGDIVTEINGLDLTDMQQSLEAMHSLKEIQSLQMTISRDDELLTIYLDIPSAEQE
jgi:general secretion pathway protein C